MPELLALAAPEPAETIFAILVLGGLFVSVVLLVFAPGTVRAAFADMAVPLAALVAVGAMGGSLYFSESRGFVPCELCWYQRIAMYPLAVALPIVAWRRERAVIPYAIGSAVIGAMISAYHYQLQVFPDQGSSCSADAPCSARWIEVFGFVSIPLLALGAFTLITVLLITAVRHNPALEEDHHES